MKIVYDAGIEDMVHATLFYSGQSPTARRARLVRFGLSASIFLIAGIPLIWFLGFPYPVAIGIGSAAGIASFVVNMATWRPMMARTLRKLYRETWSSPGLERHELELTEENLHTKSPKGESNLSFDFITDFGEDDAYHYLICDRGATIPIPKWQIIEGDADAFVAALRRAIDAGAKSQSRR